MRYSLPIALLLSGCLADAMAENTPRPASSQDRQGSSGAHLGGTAFQSSNAVFCALDEAGAAPTDTDLLFFPYGSQVVIYCATTQVACWTQANSPDITSIGSTDGLVDAHGPDGRGACVPVGAGTYRSTVLERTSFESTSAVGRRSGVCTTGGFAGATGRPCRVDGDCQTGAGETCLADAFSRVRGAFLCASAADCLWVNE
jgi:hypothetical protein